MSENKVSDTSILSKDFDSSKVFCTNHYYLKHACGLIAHKIEQMVEVCGLREEQKEVFKDRFKEAYDMAIQENVRMNGLPLEVCKDRSMTTVKKQEKDMIINESLLPKLGKVLVQTVNKRKNYPQQCCRIMKQRLKHKRQSLKQSHGVSLLCALSSGSFDDWPATEETFEHFSQQLTFFTKSVQTQIDGIQKIDENIRFAKKIPSHQKRLVFGAPLPFKDTDCLSEKRPTYPYFSPSLIKLD